ncbi:MAG: hypothetical protein QXI36_01790 [Candidatus Bathyarchaeia archaeon]
MPTSGLRIVGVYAGEKSVRFSWRGLEGLDLKASSGLSEHW